MTPQIQRFISFFLIAQFYKNKGQTRKVLRKNGVVKIILGTALFLHEKASSTVQRFSFNNYLQTSPSPLLNNSKLSVQKRVMKYAKLRLFHTRPSVLAEDEIKGPINTAHFLINAGKSSKQDVGHTLHPSVAALIQNRQSLRYTTHVLA